MSKEFMLENPLLLSKYLNSRRDEKNKTLNIYYGVELIMIVDLADVNGLYLQAMILVERGFSKNRVSELFGFDRSWMTRLARIFKKKKYAGILEIYRGAPTKITEEISEYAIEQLKEHYAKTGKIYGYREKILNQIKEKFEKEISIEALRKIIKDTRNEIKNAAIEEGKKRALENVGTDSFEDSAIENNIPISEAQCVESGEKQCFNNNVEETAIEKTDKEIENTKIENRRGEEIPYSEATENLIGKKVFSRYAGLFLLHQYIIESNILESFKKHCGAGYLKLKTIIVLWIYMIFLSKIKIENYKEIKHSELERILNIRGMKRLEDIRAILRATVKFEEMTCVNKERLSIYINQEENKEYWLFMDGRVLQYFCKKKILENFKQQTHCPVRSRIHYFMHLSNGQPVYFEMNDSYNDFREVIRTLINAVKEQTGELYKNFLYVFDRGGYGFELFYFLQNTMKVFFAVWMKDDKTEYSKKELKYEEIKIELAHNRIDRTLTKTIYAAVAAEKFILKDTKNKKSELTLTVRKIVIRAGSKYTVFITNDTTRTLVDLTKAMQFRWREEKAFEQDVKKRGLSDINSYKSELFSNEVIENLEYEKDGVIEVESEECIKLKKERAALKKEIHDARIELSKILEDKKKSKKERNAEYAEKFKKIKTLKINEKILSKKIKIEIKQGKIKKIDSLIAKGVERLDYSQKFFIDILRVVCSHIEKNMMQDLSAFYINRRDIFKYVSIMIQTGGWIQHTLEGKKIITLSRLNTETENDFFEKFIKMLNEQTIVMNANIEYRLEKISRKSHKIGQ